MAERDLIQQLDLAVEAMLSGSRAFDAGPEVTELAAVADIVRDLPDKEFRASLKKRLMGKRKEKVMTATTTGKYLREGFRSLTPYLHLRPGTGIMEFIKDVFGAEELLRVPRPDGSIMHAEVRIGDSIVELAEVPEGPMNPPGFGPTPLHVYVPNVDEVYERAMALGATSLYTPSDHEYGERGASVKDASGNHWYLATAKGPHYIPEKLHSVNVYLSPRGTSEFIDFLKRAFGAEEDLVHKSPDGTIVHGKIRMGDSILEMGEAHAQYQPMPCAIHYYVPNVDEVYGQALAAGATSIAAPSDQPYGDRFAGVTDPQGNRWYLATHIG
jgi:PhnB protein